MNDTKKPDELKLDVEREKVEIEREKVELTRKSLWLDVAGKVGLPLAVLVFSWVTYSVNKEQAETRLHFDINAKQAELNQKDQDLFLKKSELQRSHEQMKNDFVQRNIALVMSRAIEDQNRLTAMIEVAFSREDQLDVAEKIAHFRQATSAAIQQTPQTNSQPSLNYKEIGLGFVKQGNFDQAALNFETATLLNPSDAESWNFRAYAQMRVGRIEDAYKSISTAINLRTMDKKTQNNMAINATKILCSAGKSSEALAYLKTAAGVLPDLYSVAAGDGELKQRCGFSFGK